MLRADGIKSSQNYQSKLTELKADLAEASNGGISGSSNINKM